MELRSGRRRGRSATSPTRAAAARWWTEDFWFVTQPAVDPELEVRLNALDVTGEHVWAVGRVAGSGAGRPRIERYSRLPDVPGVAFDAPEVAGDSALNGVVMVSAAEGWAVGGPGPVPAPSPPGC
jgi:hypothetical protein